MSLSANSSEPGPPFTTRPFSTTYPWSAHHRGGVEAGDGRAVEGHGAFGDVASMHADQAGDGPEQRGLARPVCPEKGDDGPIAHVQRDAAEDEDHVAVDDLEAVYSKDRLL